MVPWVGTFVKIHLVELLKWVQFIGHILYSPNYYFLKVILVARKNYICCQRYKFIPIFPDIFIQQSCAEWFFPLKIGTKFCSED